MASIFLSHSSKDKLLAKRIANDLREAGIQVWLDEWEILIGDSITQQIQQGLEQAEFVVVLLTRHSVESGWVEKEWQSKIGQEAASRQVAVLPLKADDCAIPPLLRDKKYADFQQDYTLAINDLLTSIQGHTGRRRSADPLQLRTSPLEGNAERNIIASGNDNDVTIYVHPKSSSKSSAITATSTATRFPEVSTLVRQLAAAIEDIHNHPGKRKMLDQLGILARCIEMLTSARAWTESTDFRRNPKVDDALRQSLESELQRGMDVANRMERTENRDVLNQLASQLHECVLNIYQSTRI